MHSRYFLFNNNETFKDIIFSNHLELQEDLNPPNLTIFDHYLPPIKIQPTIFGWSLVAIIVFLLVLVAFVVLYFFNTTFANLLGVIQCCKDTPPPNPVILQMQQQPHNESNESLHDWKNLQAYGQN